jgi:hypothetical protein
MTTDSPQAQPPEAPERIYIHAGAKQETKPCGCGHDIGYVREDLPRAAADDDAIRQALTLPLKRVLIQKAD